MDFFSVIRLIFSANKKIRESSNNEKSRHAAYNYLKEKYKLSDLKDGFTNFGYSGHGFSYFDEEWVKIATDILQKIINKKRVDEELYSLCGEIIMFLLLFDYYPLSSSAQIYPITNKLRKVNETETHKSLLEMSRGRGSEYALRLIQNELGQL
jgi:hypothetical protein